MDPIRCSNITDKPLLRFETLTGWMSRNFQSFEWGQSVA